MGEPPKSVLADLPVLSTVISGQFWGAPIAFSNPRFVFRSGFLCGFHPFASPAGFFLGGPQQVAAHSRTARLEATGASPETPSLGDDLVLLWSAHDTTGHAAPRTACVTSSPPKPDRDSA